MSPSAFEPAFPGSEQAQTRALDRAAIAIGCESRLVMVVVVVVVVVV